MKLTDLKDLRVIKKNEGLFKGQKVRMMDTNVTIR